MQPERPRRPGRKATIADWDRYHEAKFHYDVWRQGQIGRKVSAPAEAIVTAAFGIAGALTHNGMSGIALTGSQDDASDFGRGWGEATAYVERQNRSRAMDEETRSSGDRKQWTRLGE